MSAALTNNTPGRGHNAPPGLIVPTKTEVEDHLKKSAAALKARAEQMKKMVADFLADHPVIKTEDQQATASDVVGQVKKALKDISSAFDEEKKPWREGGKAVDTFFNSVKALLDVGDIERMQTAYARAVAAKARAEALAAAAAAQAEADRLAEQAVSDGLNLDLLDQAQHVASDAQEALATAKAKAAELSRVRSDHGVTSSLREVLVVELQDITKVPPEFLQLNESAVRAAALSAKKEGRPFSAPGVSIKWQEQIQNYVR